MKILLASVDFTPHRDGVSVLSHHVARRLAERGHAVTVVAPGDRDAQAEDAAAPYRVYRFPGYGLGLARAFPFTACMLLAFLRHRPDVVLPMNIGYGGLPAWALSRVTRSRYVMFAYAYEFLKARRLPPLRWLYRRIYGGALFVVAISEFTRAELIAFGVAADRIRIACPGVDPRGAGAPDTGGSAVARGPRAPTLGTCGRLIARKGHDLVLRALPRVRKAVPDARYRIAGAGPERERLAALARELGVAEQVEFLGVVPDAELPAFYRSLDVFVMPGREDRRAGHVEGFGIVYLEAALEGVPSVATRTGGVPEAVLDGVTGLLVPPEDIAALAAALTRLLSDAALRHTLGDAARRRAATEFDWNRQVDQVADWLDGAAASAPVGRHTSR